jgi:hypothetical protein
MTKLIYALGVRVDWQNYTKSIQKYRNAKKVVLPNYAFDKVTCWFSDKPFRSSGATDPWLLSSFHVVIAASNLQL